MNKSIAVILAKAESKRLRNKNFLTLGVNTIVHYPENFARLTDLFDTIIISTDKKDFNSMYKSTIIYKRKKKNTKQNSTMYDALIEVLEAYPGFKNVCMLYACNPLITSELITSGYEKLKQGYDTVFPVVEDSGINRALVEEDGKIYSVFPGYNNTNTQQQVKKYQHTGMYYWCNIEALKRNVSIMNSNMAGVKISKMECQNIYDSDDWEIAKWKYNNRIILK